MSEIQKAKLAFLAAVNDIPDQKTKEEKDASVYTGLIMASEIIMGRFPSTSIDIVQQAGVLLSLLGADEIIKDNSIKEYVETADLYAAYAKAGDDIADFGINVICRLALATLEEDEAKIFNRYCEIYKHSLGNENDPRP